MVPEVAVMWYWRWWWCSAGGGSVVVPDVAVMWRQRCQRWYCSRWRCGPISPDSFKSNPKTFLFFPETIDLPCFPPSRAAVFLRCLRPCLICLARVRVVDYGEYICLSAWLCARALNGSSFSAVEIPLLLSVLLSFFFFFYL